MLHSIFFKKIIFLLAAVLLLAPPSNAHAAGEVQDKLAASRAAQAADELVAAVNTLRNENGLGALSVNPILMQITQAHAEYMASTDQITHFQPDGKRPFQRALEAGFPVAGDLSLGGFYSENIVAGPGLTPQAAVEMWLGDDPHTSTMLSQWRSHMGVGVAYNGDIVYYALDTALYSSEPVSQTVVAEDIPTQGVLLAPIALNTPEADGSLRHLVHTGETLWAIAAVYNISLDQLIQLNSLKSDQFIYPGDQLLIRAALTPTSSPNVPETPTRQFEITQSSTPTSQPEAVGLLVPTATSLFGDQPVSKDPLDVIVPVVLAAAFLILAVILWYGFRKGTMA